MKTYVRNGELLRRVARAIAREPESYNQGDWATRTSAACGTAYCVAGHAMVELGYQWDRSGCRSHIWCGLGERVSEAAMPQLAAEALGIEYELEEGDDDPYDDPHGYIYSDDDVARNRLFGGGRRPLHGLTVVQALEKIAAGIAVEDVWGSDPTDPDVVIADEVDRMLAEGDL